MIVLLFIIISLLAMSSFIFMICFYKALRVVNEIDMLEDVRIGTAKMIIDRYESCLHEKGAEINYIDIRMVTALLKDEYGL